MFQICSHMDQQLVKRQWFDSLMLGSVNKRGMAFLLNIGVIGLDPETILDREEAKARC